jgi:hypothetical membrane protein
MKNPTPQAETNVKVLLAAGVAGCLLFIVVFLIEGALRPGYDPMKHPVSSLSIGESGWIQRANFIISGGLILVFSLGLRFLLNPDRIPAKGPFIFLLSAIGLIGAGIFTTDPVYGYPEDMPLFTAQFTTRGHLHDLFSLLFFVNIPVACFVFRRRFILMNKMRLASYSKLTAIVMLLFFVLAGAGFKQTPGLMEVAGLLQRLSIILGLVWVAVLGIYLIKMPLSGNGNVNP